ncbi:hypothetical protein LCGC14_0937920 [marine sediment metagenome]|uniref:Uncharacterized protein n=1 Tax=marine sediment metagenome TaxID=412755 RepID=A0A0F9R4J3_9ZZZZ|nr:hypothetical protein [Candidatus Aminicenantes bacterium]
MKDTTRTLRENTGMTIGQIAKYLGIPDRTFRYRVKENVLHLEDYHKLIGLSGVPFERLFPDPTKQTIKKLPLNLRPPSSKISGIGRTAPQTKKMTAEQALQQLQKQQETTIKKDEPSVNEKDSFIDTW